MVSWNFIKSIIYGLGLMLIAAGLMYGFTLTQKDSSASNSEKDYISKLTTVVDNMKNIEIDETTLMQKWAAETINTGTAVAEFADIKAKRQKLDDDFFSRAAPQKFTEIHITLKDANTVWMEADDLYREGIFQRRNDFISDADSRVMTAKQKFDEAIAELKSLGYDF